MAQYAIWPLTGMAYQAIMRHMTKTRTLIAEKVHLDAASIVQMRVIEVPSPVLGSKHSYKYSFVYVVDGVRIIGYDNERTKGDHRHYRETEEAYQFVSVRKLMDDFLADVAREREGR